MAREDVYWVAGDHEQTLEEGLEFVSGQAATHQELGWRSQQPLGALVGDVPDDEQLLVLDLDPTDLTGVSREHRDEIWPALRALERVIALCADNAPQVAWDDDAVLTWAAFAQDHEPLRVEIILERAAGGVQATVETSTTAAASESADDACVGGSPGGEYP